MGIVYRARDAELKREVALKCPWPAWAADPHHRERFLREARAAARISHPNVIEVYEVFEHEGHPWLALQLIAGEDLEALLLAKGRQPVPTILRIAEDLATALQAAHAHDVLHRDVKPRNVLITPDGRALLGDFGLARILPPTEVASSLSTQKASLTQTGAIVGTPRYMSPEQALGKPLDARSDIFSLGTVLYEMCTGSPAFSPSEEGGLYEAIIHREPEPISRFTYEVPAELERIIRKTIAKLPEERYPDARDLLVDLCALRRKLEHEEYAEAHPRETVRAPGRRRWTAALVTLTAVAAAAAIALWLTTQRDRDLSLPRGQPRQITRGDALEWQPAFSPDGGRIAFASNAAGNLDIYIVDARGGNPLQLTQHPASDQYPTWFPDGSALAFQSSRGGKTAIWKIGQLGGGATLILEDAGYPAISPDGRRIAFSTWGPGGKVRIGVTELDDPANVTMITHDNEGIWNHRHPAWSPDGQRVCYAAHHNLWVVPAAGGGAQPLSTEGKYDSNPAWSPSGRHVYFSSDRDGTLALWFISVATGRVQRLTMGTGRENHCSVARDGSRIAYSTQETVHELIGLDLSTGAETPLRSPHDAVMPAVAPDKSSIVFVSSRGGSDSNLWRQPLEAGVPADAAPQRLTEQTGEVSHPIFSADGRWVAYYRILGSERRDVWVVPAAGGQPVQITDHTARDIHPAWSPDGNRLAFVSERDGSAHIWLATFADGRRTGSATRLTQRELRPSAPVWSPDGTVIAFVGVSAGTAEVWILPSEGSAPARRVTHGAGARRIRWHPVTGGLLVSGLWGRESVSLRSVAVDGGESSPLDPPPYLGPAAVGFFDISADGTFLVYPRDDLKGNIWLLEATNGTY